MKDDTKQTRRRFLKATGGAATAVALAGCLGGDGGGGNGSGGGGGGGGGGGNGSGGGGGNQSGQQTQQNVQANPNATLQLVNSTITTFDPVAATDTASGTVIRQMFAGLMQYPNGEASPTQQLASNYELSGDQTTYTFSLKDATFHNGDTVTAQDFVYAWERLAQSSNSQRAYFILDSLGVQHETDSEGTYVPNSMAVEAVDEKTLEFTLSGPFHSSLAMLAYTSFAAVPEGIVGDIQGSQGQMGYSEFANGPIGAGPFKFESYQSGTQANVTRYDDYFDGAASIGGIHWQVISRSTAAYNYSMEKSSDIISMPTAQYSPDNVSVNRGPNDLGQRFGTYGPLRNGETAQYFSVPEISTYYLGFNMAKVPKAVRQAFAYVANQQLLTEEVFKGRGEPAYHTTPPSIYPGGAQSYTQHAEQNYPYGYNQTQIEQARQVLSDAGYTPDSPFTVQWTQYEDDSWLELGKLFRDQLASVGVNMQIQQADFSTLIERGLNGQLEVYTLGWIADWPAPDNFLQLLNPPQTQTSGEAPISYINWSQETGTAAQQAAQAYSTVSENQAPTDQAQQARNQAYVQIEEANWEDVGFLNLYHSLGERFWYDWLEIPPYGGMGGSRQMYNNVKIGQRN